MAWLVDTMRGKEACRVWLSCTRAQALRSLETGLDGWSLPKNWKRLTEQEVVYNLRVPNPERMLAIKQARVLHLRLSCMPS